MAVFGEKFHDPAMINEAFRLRSDEYMSIKAISERVGIPRSTLGDYLKGEGECFHEKSCRFCGAMMFSTKAHRAFCNDGCRHKWLYRNNPAYRARALRRSREYKRRKRAETKGL